MAWPPVFSTRFRGRHGPSWKWECGAKLARAKRDLQTRLAEQGLSGLCTKDNHHTLVVIPQRRAVGHHSSRGHLGEEDSQGCQTAYCGSCVALTSRPALPGACSHSRSPGLGSLDRPGHNCSDMTLARPTKVSSFCVGVAAAGAAYLSTKVCSYTCTCLRASRDHRNDNLHPWQHMLWSRVASAQQHRGPRQSETPKVFLGALTGCSGLELPSRSARPTSEALYCSLNHRALSSCHGAPGYSNGTRYATTAQAESLYHSLLMPDPRTLSAGCGQLLPACHRCPQQAKALSAPAAEWCSDLLFTFSFHFFAMSSSSESGHLGRSMDSCHQANAVETLY